MAEPETRRPSRNKDHVFIRGLGTVNEKITSIECHVKEVTLSGRTGVDSE